MSNSWKLKTAAVVGVITTALVLTAKYAIVLSGKLRGRTWKVFCRASSEKS